MTWSLPERKERILDGVTLRPLQFESDREGLWDAARPDKNRDLFEFMLGTGPFTRPDEFDAYLRARFERNDILVYVVTGAGRTLGSLTLFDCSPAHGTCEIGSVWFRRDVHGIGVLETCCLSVMTMLFEELNYRRVVWKCNSANEASNRAARALGFQFEGTFRQHFWDKGRNRDTNWYSVIDGEWTTAKAAILATRERKQKRVP